MNFGRAIFVVLLVFPWACQFDQHKDEKAKIDSLKLTLQLSEKQLEKVNYKKLESAQKKSSALIDFIEKNYRDTMDLQRAVMLSDYAFASKSMFRFDSLKENYSAEIEFSRGQLDTLQKDLNHTWILGIERSAIPEDSLVKYLRRETKVVAQLNKSVESSVDNLEAHLHKYDSLHPEVLKIVEELEAKRESDF